MFTLHTAWLLAVSFFLFAYFQISRYIVDSWVAKSVSSDQWFSNIRSVSGLQLKLLWILYKGSGFSHLVCLAWIPGSLLFYCVHFKSTQLFWWSASHVWMWERDNKKGWALKNWCLWTMVLAKTFESPLDSKEIKPVNPKGNQPWILTGKTDTEAPLLWPLGVKSQLIRKDPDAGKDWRQEKGVTDDEIGGWHHWLSRHELLQALGDGERQGNLACCSPWGCRVGHARATEQQQLGLGATASDNKLFNQSEITWGKLLPAV